MNRPDMGFAAGRFFCRFLTEQPRSDVVLIEDQFWEEDDPPLIFQNIAGIIRDEVEQQVYLNKAPFASWLLARLWYLSHGAIYFALDVDKNGLGMSDGGNYLVFALVEDNTGRIMAEMEIEGMSIFTQMILTARSIHVSPSEVIKALADTLKAQPNQIAVCRIAISDPEQLGVLHEYGWDGKQFLGTNKI